MNTTTHSYDYTLQTLLQQASQIRQPASGTFELTSRCNLSCRMCYVRHSAGDRCVSNSELRASQWVSLAEQAVNEGMIFLLLTGGEIFVRPDFFEIYESLSHLGIYVTLFTNGTLVSEAVARRLSKNPPSMVEVTLYGATATTYESITISPGSYARCCTGIENLLKQQVPVTLKTTITQQNVDELEAMQQMAENWGLPFFADWLLSKRRDGLASDVDSCRLPAPECIDLEEEDRGSAHTWVEQAQRESGLAGDDNFYCQAGQSSFVITSSGEMNLCLDLPKPTARPIDIGFSMAWHRLGQFRDSAPPISQDCMGCDAKPYCPRCPAWSYLENGSLTDPVPYLCEIAQERRNRYLVSCDAQ